MKYILLLFALTCLMSCVKIDLESDIADCYPVTEILMNVQTSQVLDVNNNSDMCHCLETTYSVNLLNKNKIIYAVKCIPQ